MKMFIIQVLFIIIVGQLYGKDKIVHAYISTYSRGVMLVKEFEKETGIKVIYNEVKISTNEALVKLEEKKDNPEVSIWIGGVGLGHIEAKQKGLTIPYRSKYTNRVRTSFKDISGYWHGLYIGSLVIGVNIDMLKDQNLTKPLLWEDLLSGKYKDKIRIGNPNSSGTAYNFITTILDVNMGDEGKTFEYLSKFDNNVNYYTKSGSQPGKDCAKGETPIAIGYAHDFLQRIEEGANIEIILPKEGTGYEISSMSLIKNGPDIENAKILFDWILGDKGQRLLLEGFVIPISKNIPTDNVGFVNGKKYLDIKKIKTVKQDMEWDAKNRGRLIKKWNKEIGEKSKNKIDR